MKKSLKVISVALTAALFITLLAGITVSASGATISVKQNVKVGEAITVTCTFEDSIGMYYYTGSLDYNPSIMQFVSGGTDVGGSVNVVPDMSGETSYSFSVTFNVVAAGQAGFSFSGAGSNGATQVSHSASCVVTATNPTPTPTPAPTPTPTPSPDPVNPSSDANLVSLKVSGAELTPAFSKSVTNYTATVKYQVDKATLSATAASGATFAGAGTFDLAVGNNSHTVTVTAADKKTKKSYTVNIRRMTEQETKEAEKNAEKGNPLAVTVGGRNYTILPDISTLGVFEGYTAEKAKRGETEVTYLLDKGGKYKLYYLTDADGAGGYFNQKGDNAFEKVNYLISGTRLYIVNYLPDDVKLANGYRNATLVIDKRDVPAVQFTDAAAKDIYILYCYVNGQNGYYRYDAAEKTVSRAPEFAATLSKKAQSGTKNVLNFFERFMNMSAAGKTVLLLMISATLGILLIIILFIIKAVKKKHPREPKAYIPEAEALGELELTEIAENAEEPFDNEKSPEIEIPEEKEE